MCMLPLFALFRRIAEPTPYPPPEISSSWGTSIAITPSGTQRVLPTPVERKYLIESSIVMLFSSMTLTYQLDSIAPLAVASPYISLASFSLAVSSSWEVLKDLGFDHLPILLTVSLSPVLSPNERPPSFNFQKACGDDFAFCFDSHCPFCRGILLSFLCCCSLYFSDTECGQIFHSFWPHHTPTQSLAEVEEAVGERRKAFAAAHISDKYRQPYISVSRHALSAIAKAKAEAWQATCSSLSPKLNPKSVYSFLRSVAGLSSSSSSSPDVPQLFLS